MSRPLTFRAFSYDWLRHFAVVEFKSTTVDQLTTLVRLHLLPVFGTRVLGEIDALDLQRYVAERLLAGYSPRTVRNDVIAIRRMFATALVWGLIDTDPAVGLRSPRQPRREVPFLTPPQLHTLVEATPVDLRLITALPAYVGMRRGEVLSARFDRLDMERRTLLIDSSKRGVRFHDPKSRASLATVEFPATLAPLFEQRRSLAPDKDGLILCRQDGQAYADSFPNRVLKTALYRAGLPQVTFHQLRGSWVYAHIQAGTPLGVIQRLGRWESVETLIRAYGRWLPSEAGDAADAVGALIGEVAE